MKTILNLDVEIKNDYHLGHIILDCFKKRRKDFICQIDAATGERQTYGTTLDHVVRLARSLRNMGFKPGDIMLIGGANHIKLRIPYYAGILLGLPVSGIDSTYKTYEIKIVLEKTKAKLAFCDYASYDYYKKAAEELGSDITIVTFDTSDLTLDDLINKSDNEEPIEDFRPSVFDVDKVYAVLMGTSGSTGTSKLAAAKHAPLLEAFIGILEFGIMGQYSEESQQNILSLGALQWVASYMFPIGILLTGNTLVISSKYTCPDDLVHVITKYKPAAYLGPQTMFYQMVKEEKACDMTCFDVLLVGGAIVPKDLFIRLKPYVRKDALVAEGYGQTEMLLLGFNGDNDSPIGSCGIPGRGRIAKLVDLNTNEEIMEPYVRGHLLFKGPMFSEYYGDPEETANAFTADGWVKSGDVLYRDENGEFYYVDRIKMFFKYRTLIISPSEVEDVILTLPSVLDVCVTSIEHPTDENWPVAVVVRRPGYDITAQEIKDLVAEKLSDAKKLRGGVIFVDELPKTGSGKIARAQVRAMAAKALRE